MSRPCGVVEAFDARRAREVYRLVRAKQERTDRKTQPDGESGACRPKNDWSGVGTQKAPDECSSDRQPERYFPNAAAAV